MIIKYITLFLLTVTSAINLHAAIWTVDNNTSRPADFRTIQEAIDAAAVGDTLMIAGSSVNYGAFLLTKRLNIKGPGDTPTAGKVTVENTNGFSANLTRVTDTMSPDNGRNAGGSVIEGIYLQGVLDVGASCSFVSFKRLHCSNNIDIRGAGAMVINCRAFSFLILQGANTSVVGTQAKVIQPRAEQILIDNCIIGENTQAGSPISSSNTPTLRSTILISNSAVGTSPYSGATFDHCMAIGNAALPSGNGNVSLPISQYGNVFTMTSSVVLKPGGPAVGTGKNGVDMGMYGGSNPYIDGYIPALPRITEIIVPPVVPDSSGLTFEVKAEARD
jgi:hypothetical protein